MFNVLACLTLVRTPKGRSHYVDNDHDDHEDTNSRVVQATLDVVLLPAGDPLHQEEAGGHHLEYYGETDEDDEERSIGRTQIHGVT